MSERGASTVPDSAFEPTTRADEGGLNSDHLICEDGKPVDSIYAERLMRFLVETLYTSWSPGRPFLACANVGVFWMNKNPAIVPDVFVSLDVTHDLDAHKPSNNSYLLWEKGKPPDVVIEIVSNTEGGELTTKRRIYAENVRVTHYIVWDPIGRLGGDRLQSFILMGDGYQTTPSTWFPKLGLGLKTWKGTFEGCESEWLRWYDAAGNFLSTGDEHRQRTDRLAAKLRQAGIDPDAAE